MRQATQQNNFIAFRASDRLVSALQERARECGVSVSEYMRGVVRDKVGLQ